MLTEDDVNDALDAWIADERERLGGPPTNEEIVAFLRGELPQAEALRVQALLAYYPELTPLLKERQDKDRATRKGNALRVYAGAATLTVAVLAAEMMRRSSLPAVPSSAHEFNPLLARGPAEGLAFQLPAGQSRYLITTVPTQPPAEREYQLEITRDGDVLWRAEDVRPLHDTFVVDIPGSFLKPGTYALNVRADGRLVERYPFRVTP